MARGDAMRLRMALRPRWERCGPRLWHVSPHKLVDCTVVGPLEDGVWQWRVIRRSVCRLSGIAPTLRLAKGVALAAADVLVRN